jgi:hypothetical protein
MLLRDKIAAVIAVAILAVGYCHDAFADGPTKTASILPEIPGVTVKGGWTGCGVGVSGAGVIGQADFGAPVNISSEGQLVSVLLACDVQAGQMVFGGAIEHGWFFGDLNKIGLDTDLTIRGRAGFLIAPNTLLFGHAGWSRVETTGAGSIDGWKFGPGISIKLPNSSAFLDFRYDYGVWDSPFSGVDLTSHAAVVSLTFKFGAK